MEASRLDGNPGYFGKYKGVCRDNNDPRMTMRIRAEVPYPLGLGLDSWSTWALPCLPPGIVEVPEEGDGVWIEFEEGDPNRPVWVGVWYKGEGGTTEVPFQATHAALTGFAGETIGPDGRPIERDKEHIASVDPVSHAEHSKYHDHVSLFYTPHRRGQVSGTGHSLEWNDHPGKEGYVKLADRFGRFLRMTARGLVQLKSQVVTAASALWNNLSGSPIESYHKITMADLANDASGEDAGQWLELMDMAKAYLRFTSTPGNEQVKLADFWDQYLLVRSKVGEQKIELRDKALARIRMNAVAGAEYVEIVDKDGQTIKFNPVTGTIVVSDKNSNIITLKAGEIVLKVAAASKVSIGGEGEDGTLQPLATKSFVQNLYNTHQHICSAPGSVGGIPFVQAPLTPGSDITKKTEAE